MREASAASSASFCPGAGRVRSMVSKACRRQPQTQHLRASAAARSIATALMLS